MEPRSAGVWRRLAAASYDGLLLLAVLMVVTALLQLATHGAAIDRHSVGGWVYAYDALLIGTITLYFGICWTRRGQTLGMKAWQIRLETSSGTVPSWRAVALRLAAGAPLYLLVIGAVLAGTAHTISWPLAAASAVPLAGSLVLEVVTRRGTLPDRVSGTRIIDATPDRREPTRA